MPLDELLCFCLVRRIASTGNTTGRSRLHLLIVAYTLGVLDIANAADFVWGVEFLKAVVLRSVSKVCSGNKCGKLTAQLGNSFSGGPPGPPNPAADCDDPDPGLLPSATGAPAMPRPRPPPKPDISAACSPTN